MTTQKNGTAIPTNGTKTAAETTVKTSNGTKVQTTVPAAKIVNEIPKKLPLEAPPVEDRILRVQQLSDLVARREKLHESFKKLSSINAASENRDLKITIEDSENEWETFNTPVIKTCIETMKETIKGKLAEVENQIQF